MSDGSTGRIDYVRTASIEVNHDAIRGGWRYLPKLFILLVLVTGVGLLSMADAEASHRSSWKVYPVVFYGNNQPYDSNWAVNAERLMEQVRGWYKEQLSGETFELGSVITIQGSHSWQYYYNFPDALDGWDAIWSDIASAGEHVGQSGYIYTVFSPFNAPYLGSSASNYTWGKAMAGPTVFDHSERPDDCLPDWNCPYTQVGGGVVHELAHALNIDPHDDCDPGISCLKTQWKWPLASLTANQKADLLANSPFIAPASGSVPNAPSNLNVSPVSDNGIKGCYNDNSIGEQFFYQYIEQWNSGDTHPSIYKISPYTGTGNRCDTRYPWWSPNDGSWTFYHLKVWGQGSGGNSAKASANPFWIGSTMRARPTSPNVVYTYGYFEGYSTGIWTCWYDRASNEDGFFIKQQPISGDPNSPEYFYFRSPQTLPVPAWTCHWNDVAVSGYYYFDVVAFREPSSSTTCTVSCPEQPVPLSSGHVYGVPTSTQ